MNYVIQELSLLGIQAGITLAVIILIMTFVSSTKKNLVLLFIALFVASALLLIIPRIQPLQGNMMNWQGKTLTILFALACYYHAGYPLKKEYGFTFRINNKVWLPFLIFTLAGFAFNYFVSGLPEEKADLNYLFFELTMPGLSEEMIYRGVLLGILNVVFISRVNVFGTGIGWAVPIQSLLFGLANALYFDGNSQLQFHIPAFTVTFSLGLIMSYLKERGQSIIPAILFHNIYNATLSIISLFIF